MVTWRAMRSAFFTAHTVTKLAELRGETVEAIAGITTANFRELCLPAGNGNE